MEHATLSPLIERYARQPESLGKQIRLELALREVVRHDWPLGARLPGHRTICEVLGVARNTLARAMKSLISDGYLRTGHGQGTWTSRPHPDAPARYDVAPEHSVALSVRAQAVLDEKGAGLIQSGAFVPGIPDIARFPMRKWRQLYTSVTVPQNALLLSYSSGGYGPLKREICDLLRRWRHIDCDTQQVIITDGTHHGLELCAIALTDAGQHVLMESPCYWGARNVFTAMGMLPERVRWYPGHGHTLEDLTGHPVQLAYFTGTHHYPLSTPTSRNHKLALCRAAQPAYIIEDDYEFSGHEDAQLLFDPASSNHLLVGSFSKLMFPGLRLGYLVVPKPLAGVMNRLRSEVFREGRMLDQAVLAQFIADGDLDAIYQRMQRDYLGRQQVVHDQLASIEGVIGISPPSRGISLCVQLDPQFDDERVARHLLQEHLIVRPLSSFCSPRDNRRGLVLGVGMLAGDSLTNEVARLRRILESALQLKDIRL